MKSPKPSARRITTDPSGPRLDPAVHFTIHRNRESAKSLTQGILFCAKLQIMFSRRLTPLFCCLYIMRGYYFFLFSFVKWPAYCLYIVRDLGQFTRNYTQTVKRAADNKRRYAPGWVHSTCLLRGFPKGAAPHLAHDFAEQSVVCYTLCRRCPENTVAAGEGKGI